MVVGQEIWLPVFNDKTRLPLSPLSKRFASLAGFAVLSESRRTRDQQAPGLGKPQWCEGQSSPLGQRHGNDWLASTRESLPVRRKGVPQPRERHAQASKRRIGQTVVPSCPMRILAQEPAA